MAVAAVLFILPTAAGAATQAREADSVVESIGVNTHLGYNDTPYDNFDTIRQRLRELGIRYIRDGFGLGRPEIYSRVRTLAGDGIRLDAIAGDPMQRWNFGTIDQQLDMIEAELAGTLASIEGPNEYDLQGDSNWVPVLRTYTQQLWEGVKAHPSLASIPVVGPSIVLRENMAEAGDLTPWIDYGNTHTYLSGDIPERDSIWSGELGAAARNSGSKPLQTTETGYHNGINGTVGHQPTSERAAGIYMPRLFLENFRRGIARSYTYELLDQRDDPSKTDIEAAFGLLRNDFSKKPAAVAVERLIGLLSDRGAHFTPQSLEYGLSGAPSTAQQLLLQKRDGSFYLVLWNRVSAWNTGNRTDVDPPDVPVTLGLGQPIASAAVYEPNVSASPVATSANPSSLELDLSERVTVVRLVPGSGGPGPAPEPEPGPEPPPQPQPEPEPQPEPTPEPPPSAEPPAPVPAPEPAPVPPVEPTPGEEEQGEGPAADLEPAPKAVSVSQAKAVVLPESASGGAASSPATRVAAPIATAPPRVKPRRPVRAAPCQGAELEGGWGLSQNRAVLRILVHAIAAATPSFTPGGGDGPAVSPRACKPAQAGGRIARVRATR